MGKMSKYQEMSLDELQNEESELRTALFNQRVKNTTKELENTSQIRETRRDLARVKTRIRQMELEAAKSGQE